MNEKGFKATGIVRINGLKGTSLKDLRRWKKWVEKS